MSEVASELFEAVQLLGPLDAFADDGEIEAVAELEDALAEDRLILGAVEPFDEGAWKLEDVEREVEQVLQLGKARSEVVDRNILC